MAKPRTRSHWHFRLYICGQSLASDNAIKNLHAVIDALKLGKSEIEVIDLLAAPQKAEAENISLTPTLICEGPAKSIRLIGDLSDYETITQVFINSINPLQQ